MITTQPQGLRNFTSNEILCPVGNGKPGLNIYKLCQFFDMTLDELFGVEKKKYLNLMVNRDDVNKLHTTLQEFEEVLNFIFPNQETKLYHKWAEIKRLFELLLLNAE